MHAELIVKNTIEKHELIEKGSTVLLGLSGGPDSLCLLFILNDLKKNLGFELEAFHLNHMLRGIDAQADEDFVVKSCKELGVPLRVERKDIAKIAAKTGDSLETCARKERHRLLKESGEGKLIALAHNKDDQAETVLMRILRGTGTKGLCGMEYKREDNIIRPLLDVSRAEIEDYCKVHNLHPCIDKTNFEPDVTRNKIRLELIPSLEKDFNPNIKECLIRLAKNASADEEVLSNIARGFLEEKGLSPYKLQKEDISLNAEELKELGLALFSRVVRDVFFSLGLIEDVASVHIESLWNATLKKEGGKVIEFPKGYKALISKGFVVFKRP